MTGGENEALEALAENLWQYFAPKVAAAGGNVLRYYRAQVVRGAEGGKIQVRRPMSQAVLSLPYVSSAAGLAAGDQCTVLVLGGSDNVDNAFVLGDGTLSNL